MENKNDQSISCLINNKEVVVKKGTTIIEAFKQSKQDIAHYCWHPGLTVAGVCRLCFVEIENQPNLQVACNTQVSEGMKITNQSNKVKEAVRWGMDFHLINHPLDCPICDQSGECGLQDLYMQFGLYNPDMAERKVKKRKVVDLGEKIVLDTERCILCTRCVRFTDEVTKTHELGVFKRGDQSEIGTFKDRPLNNNYSLNTVDICPVGALTSKDFRFRQRVWYLKSSDTLCPGCSTGCNVKVFYNEEGLFRIQPVYNKDVNGHWMCDEGRTLYQFVNSEHRLKTSKVGYHENWNEMKPGDALSALKKRLSLRLKAEDFKSVALVVTAQYTNEEYRVLFRWFESLKLSEIYHWKAPKKTNEKDFDGLLFRSDRNPNTKGLYDTLKNETSLIFKDFFELEEKLKSKEPYHELMVVGPENQKVYPDMKEKVKLFSKAKNLTWFTACTSEALNRVETKTTQIPLKTYFEKDGTFVNYSGLKQKINAAALMVPEALSLEEVIYFLTHKNTNKKERKKTEDYIKTNHFVTQKNNIF